MVCLVCKLKQVIWACGVYLWSNLFLAPTWSDIISLRYCKWTTAYTPCTWSAIASESYLSGYCKWWKAWSAWNWTISKEKMWLQFNALLILCVTKGISWSGQHTILNLMCSLWIQVHFMPTSSCEKVWQQPAEAHWVSFHHNAILQVKYTQV